MTRGRLPLRTALELRRRPRRARWTPWRRTALIEVAVAVAVVLVVVSTIAHGVMR